MLHREGLAEPGSVAFHASTLRRALLNVVQNALGAMPQSSTVTTAGQRPATQVHLHTQDTGSGIMAEQPGQICEPLYITKPGGTGSGWSIVQGMMAAYGGQVTIQSVAG